MATTWCIKEMTHYVPGGGVIRARWECEETSSDQVWSARRSAWEEFTPDPSNPSFIVYADLTKADVLGWCYETIDKDAIEAALASEVDALENPTEASGFPWDEDNGE